MKLTAECKQAYFIYISICVYLLLLLYLGIEFYRCINRPPYCPGRIHVNAGIHHDANGKEYKTGVVKNGNHTHPPIHESVRQAQMDIR
jgi:hypothetical protein